VGPDRDAWRESVPDRPITLRHEAIGVDKSTEEGARGRGWKGPDRSPGRTGRRRAVKMGTTQVHVARLKGG